MPLCAWMAETFAESPRPESNWKTVPSLRVIALAPLALSALLLAGCAVGGGGSAPEKAEEVATVETEAAVSVEQTKQEACDIMAAGVQALAELNTPETMTTMTSDPAAGLALLDTAEAALNDSAAQVTNAEVLPAATEAAAAASDYFGYVRTLAQDPANADVSGMGAKIQSLVDGVAALGEVCAA
ncbi:hypothetical protein J7E25_16905 [Agromyces sp. ISL-38]|uniref:hypothetical protein n=1 Tax=Agromyces sp. ISL-38 TaxID=2819107 RepID=UPI001BE7E0B3|nr:hypothetical protein [Agromyces sp. ISL-38]MBT2500777.1 hypothetical protein [Agromyces sp. ISL-38]